MILIEFMFFYGKIKGTTLNQLSEDTKNKLTNILSTLDENIENYDQSKEKFFMDSTKNHFNELKDASDELIDKGKSKVKNYYEQFKNEVKNN